MKRCAAKIEDKEQEDVEWTYLQNHSQWVNKEEYY